MFVRLVFLLLLVKCFYCYGNLNSPLAYNWKRENWLYFYFCQNICSEIEIKAYVHFSHYKSMETLRCHSDESTWATAIKNTIFIEANVMNISTNFQLHLPYGFWGDDFWTFFWCKVTPRTQCFFMRTAETLIRLGGCPGWSEFSLGVHVIFLCCWVLLSSRGRQFKKYD